MAEPTRAEERNRRFYEVMQGTTVEATETSEESAATAEVRNAAFRAFADGIVNRPATPAASARGSMRSS